MGLSIVTTALEAGANAGCGARGGSDVDAGDVDCAEGRDGEGGKDLGSYGGEKGGEGDRGKEESWHDGGGDEAIGFDAVWLC